MIVVTQRRRRNRHPAQPFADVLDEVGPPEEAVVDIDWIRQKHCGTKVRRSRNNARAVANRLSQEKGAAYEAYRCVLCAHWHVGHVASLAFLRDLATVIRSRVSA